MKMLLQSVFDGSIPERQRIGFRPQIADVFSPSQKWSNQKIDLIVFRASMRYSVFLEDFLTQRAWHSPDYFFMRHGTNVGDRGWARGARSKAVIRNRLSLDLSGGRHGSLQLGTLKMNLACRCDNEQD